MPSLFKDFPKVLYKSDETGRKVLLTNIAKRFILRKEIQDLPILFENYVVQDGQRPEHVAYDYYGDPNLDWLVMLTNKVLHPQFDWYMSYQNFVEYIKGKYGSVEEAYRQVHHYEKRFVDQETMRDGYTTDVVWLQVDETTYHATPEDHRRVYSCYEWEDKLNRDKQIIRLVHKTYRAQIEQELKDMLTTNG